MGNKSIKTDSAEAIDVWLKKEERGIKWLQKKTNIPYATLYSIIVKKERVLSDKNRKLINSALKTNY